MSSSVTELLARARSTLAGAARWGERLPVAEPGVYLVACNWAADSHEGQAHPRFDEDAVARWIRYVPDLCLRGRSVTTEELIRHLAQWWLPREPVLYIGKATSLAQRVAQYYRTPLGAVKPHKGGYWLKTLADLPALTVHYAITADVAEAGALEDQLLGEFVAGADAPEDHPEPTLLLPFANLTLDRPAPRRRRDHGLTTTYR